MFLAQNISKCSLMIAKITIKRQHTCRLASVHDLRHLVEAVRQENSREKNTKMPFWIHSFSSPKIISKIISGWQRLLAHTYSDKIHTYNTDNVTKKISTLNISDLVYIVIDSRAEPILRLLTYKACVLLKYNKEKGYDSQFWAGFHSLRSKQPIEEFLRV